MKLKIKLITAATKVVGASILVSLYAEKIPLEKGIVVNNISTIYAIYKALKYDNPLVERVITITGLVDNPLNVLVKIGTPLIDIITNYEKYNKDLTYIANGPMYGKKVDIESLVVSNNLSGIVVLNNCVKKAEECTHCGKCVSICPKMLSPVLIKDNIDDIKKLKDLKAYRCIGCGLCSYICPSKINITQYVKKAKSKMEGGE